MIKIRVEIPNRNISNRFLQNSEITLGLKKQTSLYSWNITISCFCIYILDFIYLPWSNIVSATKLREVVFLTDMHLKSRPASLIFDKGLVAPVVWLVQWGGQNRKENSFTTTVYTVRMDTYRPTNWQANKLIKYLKNKINVNTT